ncbi:MAG: UbiA prenyltransferase family protein [Nannocystaceae bacterium]|nr:UbiA prenyltransferase family protein [Nannocystaceae bacterium]
MADALRIIADVARFRLRRLEMANLVAAVAIMVSLRLPMSELLARTLFGVLLNLLVYLNNDWFDLEDDLASSTRDREKTEFLAAHRPAGVQAQLGLLGALVGFAVIWGGGLLAVLIVGAGVCAAYSKLLKRRPFVDVAAMMVWGAAMPAVAVPPGYEVGWLLLVQLALFSGVFESIQVLRDREGDARIGVRTTAVVLGAGPTQALARVLMLICAGYAAWMFHPLIAIGPLCAAMMPIGGELSKYWHRVRFILGPTLLAECAMIYLGWV